MPPDRAPDAKDGTMADGAAVPDGQAGQPGGPVGDQGIDRVPISQRKETYATVDSRLQEEYVAEGSREIKSIYPESPEARANFLSQHTYHYLNALMYSGWKRVLEMTDLYPLLPEFRGRVLFDKFAPHWDKELVYSENPCRAMAPGAKAMLESDPKQRQRRGSFSVAADGTPIPVLGGDARRPPPPPGSKEKPRKPSLVRAIFGGFGKKWMLSGFLRLVADGANICSPVVLQQLIGYISFPAAYPSYFGYLMAFVLFVMQLTITVFMNAFFDVGMKVGFSVRAVLITAVYRKTLLLSQAARAEHSAGKTVNLMSTDASRVDMTIPMLHMLWSAPITIVACMALLIINLGASALVGLALLVLLFPVQGFVMKYLMGIRMKANKITDQRVKITQEAIQGIRVVKFQGWEQAMINRIEGLRLEELKFVKIILTARAYLNALMQWQPVLAAVMTFVVFSAVGGSLTPQIVFPSLALFNVIRLPLMFLPMVLTQAADASISIARLEALLLAPELQERHTVPEDYKTEPYNPPASAVNAGSQTLGAAVAEEPAPINDGDGWAIRIRDASFEWETPPKVELAKSKSSLANRLAGTLKRRGPAPASAKSGGQPNGVGLATFAGANDTITKRAVQGAMMDGTVRAIPKSNLPKDALEPQPGSPSPAKMQLRDVNLVVPKNALVCVVGPVGSGKSSLLSAIVGEMKRVDGLVQVKGDVAYCPQTPFVLNSSVRDNILMGTDWNAPRYYNTIRACAMERDLEILPDGDHTEVGERGITLSGGQKQRVSIARAVYYDANTVILDDPLSAVDAHVGRHIFEECVLGVLANKTRVLATHQLHILPKADWVVCVVNGEIVQQGKYDELLKDEDGYLFRMIRDYGAKTDDAGSTDGSDTANEDGDATSKRKEVRKEKKKDEGKPKQLMTSEERDVGAVKFGVYASYFRKAGKGRLWPLFVLLFLLVAAQLARTGADLWLGWWSSDSFKLSVGVYMGIYAAWGVLQGLLVLFMGYWFAFICLAGSSSLHNGTLESVFRSPVTFFDTTPVGRIMNRFSKDIDAVDNVLPETLRMFSQTAAMTIATFILIAVIFPYFLIVLAVALPIYYFAQAFYRSTSREIARLNSISRSPVYSLFGETLSGLSTIRAYGASNRFESENLRRLDNNNIAYYLSIMIQRWIALRLEGTSAFLVLASALFAVGFKYSLPAGLLALAVTYSLQVTSVLNWCVRQFAETEAQMNSVERLLYYENELVHEAQSIVPDNRPPPSWPDAGRIEFKGLEMRYRPDLPLVLKGVSFVVEAGKRIGIVGRTGAGKSSIMQALFRLIEPSAGSIVIDGVDIGKIGLEDLRSRLAIIPQEAFVYSSTIRENLDAFNEYTDDEVWDCLKHSGDLAATVAADPLKLEMQIAENGDNLSAGQRQLLCLARAMLRRSRVVVMDEATASVDLATDDFIQQTIRTNERFKGRTVLTIAHRLNTVVDYDRIVVMGNGEVIEFGTPAELVQKPNGVLLGMINETGRANAAALIHLAMRNATPAEQAFLHDHSVAVPGDRQGEDADAAPVDAEHVPANADA
ncbi:hypothetical protein DFJ74DRAFT_696267 [Hyaloraphidium curvatum]|nr:hypothetical protein DFJ74DRAFT_696267 [Hyaloraphidium curvatum]